MLQQAAVYDPSDLAPFASDLTLYTVEGGSVYGLQYSYLRNDAWLADTGLGLAAQAVSPISGER